MNYLIPLFDCVLFSGVFYELKANAKYVIKFQHNEKIVVFSNNRACGFLLDFKNQCDNIIKVDYKFDTYYFLIEKKTNSSFVSSFKFNNKIVNISLSDKLLLTLNGVLICEEIVDNLTYSHFEIDKDFCYIYFSGKRNFVVVIKDDDCAFASYYDECNLGEEKYFMCKLFDSLNHGKVFHIKDNEISNYLVYLDDEELNLKPCFLSAVFLDCVMAENFSYCNNLLSEELKMKDKNQIKTFFPEFDFFYPIKETTMILIKKNTLAGIYEFEIENCLIKNIIQH